MNLDNLFLLANGKIYHLGGNDNKHIDAEDQAEQARQQRIEAALQPSGDYYPFSPENFNEAIRNMPDEKIEALCDEFISAQQVGGLNYMKPSIILEEFIQNYWKKCAEKFC